MNVRIIGDVPIFVAMDSVDVWANREIFEVDAAGRATVVAGVPPDYFSAAGQFQDDPVRLGFVSSSGSPSDEENASAEAYAFVKLLSTAGTGHFNTPTKNKRLHPERVEWKKYCPRCDKHTLHKETR